MKHRSAQALRFSANDAGGKEPGFSLWLVFNLIPTEFEEMRADRPKEDGGGPGKVRTLHLQTKKDHKSFAVFFTPPALNGQYSRSKTSVLHCKNRANSALEAVFEAIRWDGGDWCHTCSYRLPHVCHSPGAYGSPSRHALTPLRDNAKALQPNSGPEQEILVILYTDGITEASNERGEEFGDRCLIESLQQHRDLPCQALLTAIVDGVRRFSFQEQQDDITAIVTKFKATS